MKIQLLAYCTVDIVYTCGTVIKAELNGQIAYNGAIRNPCLLLVGALVAALCATLTWKLV